MPFENYLKLIVNYGLGIVLAVAIAYMFWRLLLFVLRENSKREDRLAGIIELHLKAVETGNSQMLQLLMEHDKRTMEAFKYIRDENKEAIGVLREMKSEIEAINRK
jgi:hypothetical protein